jgi:hypothetical protein
MTSVTCAHLPLISLLTCWCFKRSSGAVPVPSRLPRAICIHVRSQEDPRCRGSLCTGDAVRYRQDNLAFVTDRGVPAALPRAQEADLLLANYVRDREGIGGAEGIDEIPITGAGLRRRVPCSRSYQSEESMSASVGETGEKWYCCRRKVPKLDSGVCQRKEGTRRGSRSMHISRGLSI